jgi:hypothetical protein
MENSEFSIPSEKHNILLLQLSSAQLTHSLAHATFVESDSRQQHRLSFCKKDETSRGRVK